MHYINKDDNLLKLTGSSYDIGFKHGSIAKKQVHSSLETYEAIFADYVGLSWKEAIKKALLHVKVIEKSYPYFLDEIDGVAKGAGVTFEDILVLNTRSEISLITTPDGCTSFAVLDPKESKTWLAQNWDWKGDQLDSLIHLQIEQQDLPTIEMVTEAGIIGKIGCNTSGIGVCLNALVTDTWQPKVPIHLGLRAVLEANSMDEAVSRVSDNQMASAAHFLIAAGNGEMASMEVSPIHTTKRTAANGALTHTNHFCTTEMQMKINETPYSDSYPRLATIDNLLENYPKNRLINESELFTILSNHDNYPNSICRHDSPTQNGREKMETVFSIVMDLTEKELTWIKGKPCEILG